MKCLAHSGQCAGLKGHRVGYSAQTPARDERGDGHPTPAHSPPSLWEFYFSQHGQRHSITVKCRIHASRVEPVIGCETTSPVSFISGGLSLTVSKFSGIASLVEPFFFLFLPTLYLAHLPIYSRVARIEQWTSTYMLHLYWPIVNIMPLCIFLSSFPSPTLSLLLLSVRHTAGTHAHVRMCLFFDEPFQSRS